MIKKVGAIVLAILMLTSSAAFASSQVTKKYNIKTDDPSYTSYTIDSIGKGELKEIPKQVDNSFFTIKKISDVKVVLDKKTVPIKKVWKNLPEKKLSKNMKKYKGLPLIKTTWEKTKEAKRNRLTGTYTVKGAIKKPQFPEYRDIKGNINGVGKTVKGKLVEVKKIKDYTKPFKVTATFIGDEDVEYYLLDSTKIPVNPTTPEFIGYENVILDSLGLNPGTHKITKGEWLGDYTIDDNGNTVRLARFTGFSIANSLTAFYEEEIDDEALMTETYEATCLYGNYEKPMYDVTITCIYGRTALKTERVIATAIFLAAVIGGVMLVIIKKKKKKLDKENTTT